MTDVLPMGSAQPSLDPYYIPGSNYGYYSAPVSTYDPYHMPSSHHGPYPSSWNVPASTVPLYPSNAATPSATYTPAEFGTLVQSIAADRDFCTQLTQAIRDRTQRPTVSSTIPTHTYQPEIWATRTYQDLLNDALPDSLFEGSQEAMTCAAISARSPVRRTELRSGLENRAAWSGQVGSGPMDTVDWDPGAVCRGTEVLYSRSTESDDCVSGPDTLRFAGPNDRIEDGFMSGALQPEE